MSPGAASSLYSETVLAHNRAPRNCGCLADATHRAAADNAPCGDHIELSLRVRDARIEAAMFDGESCAITTACASMLTEALRAQPPAALAELRAQVAAMFADGTPAPGEFAAFAELRHHPARQRCALLPFDAAALALKSTE
jgi:nitrogen fixation NifU-like protein